MPWVALAMGHALERIAFNMIHMGIHLRGAHQDALLFLWIENPLLPFKTAAREKIVGWYSTGPKIREADLDINGLISRFSDWQPVLVICEVQPKEIGLPFTAYYAIDEVREVSTGKAAGRAVPWTPYKWR